MLRNAILGLSVLLLSGITTATAADLEVGPGKPFATIETALAQAKDGDTILVHPNPGNAPYEKVAVKVRVPNLTIRSAAPEGAPRVKLSGEGYDYSGVGSIPRAIVQFDPSAHDGTLAGFELYGARNASHNGSGVRINGANGVTIENCEIHHNQMGIMSGGVSETSAAAGQLISRCEIHHNGAEDEPGYSHNLYLGGISARVRFCDIHHSTAGHNLKSRAHVNWVEYNYIHDSANREMDLVDGKETTRPGSDTILIGNVIAKNPDTAGNRTVIHFGQDGGNRHDGAIVLIHNTIASPFIAPVIELSGGARLGALRGNILWDFNANQRGQILAQSKDGPIPPASGSGNAIAPYFRLPAETPAEFLAADVNRADLRRLIPDPNALRKPPAAAIGSGAPASTIQLPEFPGARPNSALGVLSFEYRHPANGEPRTDADAPARGALARP